MDNLKLLALGDIFLKSKNGINPFENIKELFQDHDVIFGNLETVLSKNGKPIEKRILLRVDPENVHYLKDTGFNIVNLANNHMIDYGRVGLIDTLNILEENDIKYIGAGRNIKEATKAVIIEKDDLKIGFIGFSSVGISAGVSKHGCAPLNRGLILSALRGLRKKVDTLVISIHWGVEYAVYPSPKQQRLARILIDNGADLIIGHHPHVIQGIEEYKGRLIMYSLGNCNFATEQDNHYGGTNIGIMLSIQFSKRGMEKYELIPIEIGLNYSPYLLTTDKKQEVLELIKRISKPLKNGITSMFWFEKVSSVYLPSQIDSYIVRIKRYGIKHFLLFLKWLLTPFVFKMTLGWISNKAKNLSIHL